MADQPKHAFGIASVEVAERGKVSAIPPREKPTQVLTHDVQPPNEPPARAEKMEDVEGFAAGLERWRQWAKPWLRDLTPPGVHERPRLDLTTFDFRFEQPADLADAERRYRDEGEWERVTIPDYRGPTDKWWAYYRTRFAGADVPKGQRVYLCFEAVDYFAEVYLNSHNLGGHTGFFAEFEFDVTDQLRRDGQNTLLVRVGNDQISLGNLSWRNFGVAGAEQHSIEGDKIYAATGPGWDDSVSGWHHCPPGAGLWRPVHLEARPRVHLRDIWVRPLPDTHVAEVHAEVWVADRESSEVSASVRIVPRNFDRGPDEPAEHTLDDTGLRQARAQTNRYVIPVHINSFREWSPAAPHLYTARVTLREAGKVIDVRDIPFGMRRFTMDEQPDERGLAGTLRLNGERILLRGANTMGFLQQDVQQDKPEQLIDDILICKMAHMNFLRITQRPVQPAIYEKLDALGLMHQVDLPLFGLIRRGTEMELVKQAGEMERHVRRHPSCIMASIINEPYPFAWNQERHRTLHRHEMERLFEACRQVILLENPDRVVKATDGDYDPPSSFGLPDHHMYARWHPGHGPWGDRYKGALPPTKNGWKLGCGEYGAEGLDDWQTALERHPETWLPPGRDADARWDPSVIPTSQTVGWSRYWYDAGHSYRTWHAASNAYMADAVAEMNYAWRRRADRIVSTAIHLGIDSWPCNFMKVLVDVQRRPKSGYFAFRDSMTPVAINLRSDRRQVWAGETVELELHILNDTPRRIEGWSAVWYVSQGRRVIASGNRAVSCDDCFAEAVGVIHFDAPPTGERDRLTVTCQIHDPEGRPRHEHTFEVDVFARPEAIDESMPIAIVGDKQGAAAKLAESLGLRNVSLDTQVGPRVILADDPSTLDEHGEAVWRHVRSGTGLWLLEQPLGARWTLPDREPITIYGGGGHWRREFLRCSDHPLLAGFQSRDFFMVYDPPTDRPGILINSHVKPDEIPDGRVVLESGACGFDTKAGYPLHASVSLEVGRGRVLLDQMILAGRVPSEPVPTQYAMAVLRWLGDAYRNR